MSYLTLVRHGQATPFEKITDRLVGVGRSTGAEAGAILDPQPDNGFDEVYTGLLVRQKRTEALVAAEYSAAGVPWPVAQALPELNEYEADLVIRHLAPKLAARDEEFRRLMEAGLVEGPDRNRRFQKMFEALMARWVEGALAAPEVEPWDGVP